MLFDWDTGNRDKCQKHGVTIAEIEALLSGTFARRVDPYPAQVEQRYQALGRTKDGRALFVVFTLRTTEEEIAVRPISARYMHAKEVQKYEQDQE
jgi:uncharacterized DUF497 family protein